MIDARIAILGAGAWGTALGVTLARAGRRVTLCARRPEQRERLAADRENSTYLPGIELPQALALTSDWTAAVGGSQVVVVAIPSSFVREMLAPLSTAFGHDTTVISATKGIEELSLKTMTQALAELLPQCGSIAALSGPGFAAEVARGMPGALVAAARDEQVAGVVQRLLTVPYLRVYRSTDVLGVELGGAVKNVIAIAAGISDGLVLGSSARAALITRGLQRGSVLAAAADCHRHGQRPAGQLRVVVLAERMPEDPARAHVQHAVQVQLAFPGHDLGAVAVPLPVDALRGELAPGQVRCPPPAPVAIGISDTSLLHHVIPSTFGFFLRRVKKAACVSKAKRRQAELPADREKERAELHIEDRVLGLPT